MSKGWVFSRRHAFARLDSQQGGWGRMRMCASAVRIRRDRLADRSVTPLCRRALRFESVCEVCGAYDVNYTHPNIYGGAGRDLPERRT